MKIFFGKGGCPVGRGVLLKNVEMKSLKLEMKLKYELDEKLVLMLESEKLPSVG